MGASADLPSEPNGPTRAGQSPVLGRITLRRATRVTLAACIAVNVTRVTHPASIPPPSRFPIQVAVASTNRLASATAPRASSTGASTKPFSMTFRSS